MARIGDTVRPELGKTDYSGYLRGAQQGAAAMGQGIAALGKGVGDYLKQQKETEKEAVQGGKFLTEIGKMYEGTPLGERATMMGAQALDPNNKLKDRHAAAMAGTQAVGFGLNKMLTDFDQGLRTRAMELDELQTRGHLEINKQNADVNQSRYLTEQQEKDAAFAASQFLTDLAAKGSAANIPQMMEAHAPEDPASMEPYKGMVAQGMLQQRKDAAGKPLTINEQIALEKHQQSKIDAKRTQEEGVEATNQFIAGMKALKDHEGFSGLFGVGWGNSRVPGTKAYDARVLLEQMDAKGFMKSIQSMKGMGALSNAEGEKASIAFNGIKDGMSEKAAKKRIDEVIRILEGAQKRAASIGASQSNSREEMTVEQLIEWSRAQKKSNPVEGGPLGARDSTPDTPQATGLTSLVKQFEGWNPNAYDDYGQTSIGYGTRARKGEKSISKAEAEKRLGEELAKHQSRVDAIGKKHGYDWTPNERDALTSFDYNTGRLEQLTANGTRTKQEIAEKMLLYRKAGGEVLRGLERRRKAEQKLFLDGYAG